MLDRLKLSEDISRVSQKLFPDLEDIAQLARDVWEDISRDPSFKERAAQAE